MPRTAAAPATRRPANGKAAPPRKGERPAPRKKAADAPKRSKQAGKQRPAAKARQAPRWLTGLGVMGALAVCLVLVGLSGIGFDLALRSALRPATAVDEASAVCGDLRSRNYDALANEMDPTPDGASTGTFDRVAFIAKLRALDQRDGPVRSCALRQLNASGPDGMTIFGFTVRRAQAPDPLESLVVVRRVRGHWKVSRASSFYDPPERN